VERGVAADPTSRTSWFGIRSADEQEIEVDATLRCGMERVERLALGDGRDDTP